MIYYRKKLLSKIAEIWYNYNEKPNKKIDVLRYKFVEQKNKIMFSFEELYTILIDLLASEDELSSCIKKNTRYEINRAKNKDGIICENLLEPGKNNPEAVEKYIKYYNDFAHSKNRSDLLFGDIEQFIGAKNYCIRYARKENEIITMHAYVISDNTARLQQSCSLFRNSSDPEYKNMVARANRLLHWEDIIYFKNMGLPIYDLGGWYGGNINKEQLLINQFKESFGGIKKKEYSYIVPVSFFGYVSVLIHSCLQFFYGIFKYIK